MDTYGAFGEAVSDKVSMCNYSANRLCCEAADRAMQVHGGMGHKASHSSTSTATIAATALLKAAQAERHVGASLLINRIMWHQPKKNGSVSLLWGRESCSDDPSTRLRPSFSRSLFNLKYNFSKFPSQIIQIGSFNQIYSH